MNSGKTILVKVILAVVLLTPINAYADWTAKPFTAYADWTAKPSMLLDEWVNRPLEEFYDVWEMTPFPFLNIPGFGPPSGNISVLNSACKIRFEFQEGRIVRWHIDNWKKSCNQIITKHRRPRELRGTPLPWE